MPRSAAEHPFTSSFDRRNGVPHDDARASAASKSRYFWTRFSSEKTRRIASVEKMSRNTAESISDVGMSFQVLRDELCDYTGRGIWRNYFVLENFRSDSPTADWLRDGKRHASLILYYCILANAARLIHRVFRRQASARIVPSPHV